MREIVIQSGAVAIRARLLDTPTAEIIWRALPLYSTAEIWGKEVHFEVPLEVYLETDAKTVRDARRDRVLPRWRGDLHRLRQDADDPRQAVAAREPVERLRHRL